MIKKYQRTENLFDGIIEQGSITANGNIDATNRVRSANYTLIDTGDYTISWIGLNTLMLVFVYDDENNIIRNTSWISSPSTITLS